MRIKHLYPSAFMALIVASALPVFAQSASSQVTGTVADAAGKSLAGVTVAFRNAETGFTRAVVTDETGRFNFVNLPVGPYTATATKEGYQSATNIRLYLSLNGSAPLNVRLVPVSGTTVEVLSSVGQVDVDRSSSATMISPDDLNKLPVAGRSFLDFATLTPQVTVESGRGNLAIAGQRGINTSINLDGADNNESFFGGALGAAEGKTPFTVSIEAVREFQVVTDGASAEYGRMGGGYLNAVTKSGTNDFVGSLFYYKRPSNLVALQPNLSGVAGSNALADFKSTQMGFSFGGPIIKDKVFFFLAFDGQRKTTTNNFAWGGSTPVTLNSALASDQALLARNQAYNIPENSDVLFGRVDWIVDANNTLTFRYNKSDFTGVYNNGITVAFETTTPDVVKTESLVAQWNWTITPNLLSEFRINNSNNSLPRTARTSIPQVGISGVGTYGGNNFFREYEQKRTQIQETVTYVANNYTLKLGADWNKTQIAEIFASRANGVYSFSSFANYQLGNWSTYSQRFGLNGLNAIQSGTFDVREQEEAYFFQGDFRLSTEIKLGFGLRQDSQQHPNFPIPNFASPTTTTAPLTQTIPNGGGGFDPRLSFTWTPDSDKGNTVVRINAGRYSSRTPSVFLYQVYTVNGVRAAQVTFTPANQAALVASYPGFTYGSTFNYQNPYAFASLPVSSVVTVPVSDVFTYDPGFKNPFTDRFNVNVERAYPSGWVMGINAVYAKSERLERLRDINLGTPTANVDGRLVFPSARPNTRFRQMMMYTSDAQGVYQGVTLSAKYNRPNSPFSGQFFYTWSANRDNDSNERNFSSYGVMNTQNLMGDYGYADTDRRHVFTGSFSYFEATTKIMTGVNIRYNSGTPYSWTSSSDLNADGVSGNDRMYAFGLDTGRNAFRRSSFTTVDAKFSRDFRLFKGSTLTLSAEVFDLFNRMDRWTFLRGGSSNGSVTYTPSSTGGTRQVQLGARLTF